MEKRSGIGLTSSEERRIGNALKSFFAEKGIGVVLSPFYVSYARMIYKKTTEEAREILNRWSTIGLNRDFLLTIAKDVCNKNLGVVEVEEEFVVTRFDDGEFDVSEFNLIPEWVCVFDDGEFDGKEFGV